LTWGSSVAAVVAHDGDAVLIRIALAGNADVVEAPARAHGVDARPHRIEGKVDHALAGDGGLADDEHSRGVAVVAVLDARHIDVDDVALLQDFLVARNAVADDVIDRNAGRRRIGRHSRRRVAEAGWNALLHVHRVVVSEAVKFAGGDAGLHEGREIVEELGRKTAGNAESRNVLGRFDGNRHDVSV